MPKNSPLLKSGIFLAFISIISSFLLSIAEEYTATSTEDTFCFFCGQQIIAPILARQSVISVLCWSLPLTLTPRSNKNLAIALILIPPIPTKYTLLRFSKLIILFIVYCMRQHQKTGFFTIKKVKNQHFLKKISKNLLKYALWCVKITVTIC